MIQARRPLASLILSAVLVALAPAALAQDASFEHDLLVIASPCNTADSLPAQGHIDLCNTQISALAVRAAKVPQLTANESNIYHTLYAGMTLTVGARTAQIDGVRSERSCQLMEFAWVHASGVDLTKSPAIAQHLSGIRNNVIAAVRQCRADHGVTRPGSPALPPG